MLSETNIKIPKRVNQQYKKIPSWILKQSEINLQLATLKNKLQIKFAKKNVFPNERKICKLRTYLY